MDYLSSVWWQGAWHSRVRREKRMLRVPVLCLVLFLAGLVSANAQSKTVVTYYEEHGSNYRYIVKTTVKTTDDAARRSCEDRPVCPQRRPVVQRVYESQVPEEVSYRRGYADGYHRGYAQGTLDAAARAQKAREDCRRLAYDGRFQRR
jgi:hypothetical protein